MSANRSGRHAALFFAVLLVVFTFGISLNSLAVAEEAQSASKVQPKWVYNNLPSSNCGGHLDCHRASPLLVDLDGNGGQEIVVATNNGHIMAFRSSGSSGVLLWNRDVSPHFGMNANSEEIISSPAAADIDRDGRPEIVVGVGTSDSNKCTQGGVIVLEHDGSVKPGWPFRTRDGSVPPAGCTDTVYSTPALGDLDNDGDLEIVFGSFDKGLYVLNHNGSKVDCFPINSALFSRFGWPVLHGRLADTIWSSPSLVDLDGNGRLDILIGTDEGNFESRGANDPSDWSCPYREPFTDGYCGGSFYGVTLDGFLLPGFPKYILETIQSSPAVADVTGDGQPEIFVGTGRFYNITSPDHPTNGFRLFGWDSRGNALPGWSGGKAVGETVPASPAIGDIAGDGRPEIIVASYDGQLHAWNANGSYVSGFPMTPKTQTGSPTRPDVGLSYILADYDGDGKMEIIFNQAWTVTVVDGNGRQLTTSNYPSDGLPLYIADGLLLNNPAVGDVDGDGQLELVVQNSRLIVWDLPNGAQNADWPMFRRDAARTGSAVNGAVFSFTNATGYALASRANHQAYLPIISKGEPQNLISVCNR